ncbi:hypothetical protein DFH09DRAFT_1098027 [Mycena vulgaris]|nr:hypothetical protein DFH09DRAFT_1098027 [Mycena vulgaris]
MFSAVCWVRHGDDTPHFPTRATRLCMGVGSSHVLEKGTTDATKECMNGLGKDFISVGFAAGVIQFPERARNEVESKDISSRIAMCGFGLEITWASQDMILKHPATGCFVTHGGIFWPLSADQPMNAILVTLEHRAGLELMMVRTGGRGMMKPYHLAASSNSDDATSPSLFTVEAFRDEVNQLLSKMNSEGQLVRNSVERLQKEIAKVWNEGGEAKRELERFFLKYVD